MTNAEKVIAFIERHCRVPEGKLVGQPLKLDGFQKRFIKDLYDNPAGTRNAILSVARKNGKTGLLAALILTHLVGPMAVENSQLVSGAMSRDQAAIVFKLAAKMVRMDETLNQVTKIIPSSKTLLGLPMGTEYRALSADAGTAHGLSPVFALLDEVGQIRGPRSDFVDAITTSQGAYDDSLLIVISTQAPTDSDLLSIWIDDALTGTDPQTICHLYSAPDDCDLLDDKGWKAANPALGVFRSLRDVEQQASKASRLPAQENAFRNLILNQRVSQTNYFIGRDVWQANSEPPDMDAFRTFPVWGGLDLSKRTDLTAFVLVARDDDGVFHVWPHFWTPQATMLDRAARDRAPYDLWVKQGHMNATPGTSIDYDYVASDIAEIVSEVENLRTVAFDRWRIDTFKASCERVGIDLPLVPFGQGYKDMAPALDAVEHAALGSNLRHGGHPVLTANAANAVVQTDPAGNRKLAKDKIGVSRIDGMVALAMAMGIQPDVDDDPVSPWDLDDRFSIGNANVAV